MPTIAGHINGGIFEPDVLIIMEDAYQRVCRSVIATASIKKIVAMRIVELINQGERNPHTLCRESLTVIGVEGTCE